MSAEIINPPQLVTPKGFAHGVKAGPFVYLGGQTALDSDYKIVPGGIIEQFTQAFSNVLATLEHAGGKPSDLIDVTIYLTDVDDYQRNGREIGKIWREMAGTEYPAMAGLGVTQLWQPEALIEIQGVAYIGDDPQ
ncbi:RidA family protein [Leucobacter luti]|uniref:Enamine deaminase RidA (YjgF/YER057c/UK114 family) n=1 Tax=Leucobacter luti TaxID=340320 RepID=A0A4Q7TY65_9MICO|nr:RidA family protein [Leucobacter luti]MBL3698774.1 RidA family protein [Leucobacter luti]RZT66151.1 enamine deaminase RidA (YjgF/YER057c/UK114 family) [Leucobacter luti]